MKFLRKYHKIISLIISLFIILFAVSGIILNHRQTFSGIDVSRNILPKQYRFDNWNNASIKSSVSLSEDSILVYGDIGVWLTNRDFSRFSDINAGFNNGIDNRKITSMLRTKNGKLIAGTFFGLFEYDFRAKKWHSIPIPVHEKRISDIIEADGKIYVLTRSELLATTDFENFEEKILPPPLGYDDKIGLFKTLWLIHSGEIYGTAGKILVDIVGIIFAFLTITGFIIFYNKTVLKKKKVFEFQRKRLIRSNKFNILWHNKIGWTTTILLVITAATGMFLRPPLLIPIAETKVDKIPHSTLDSPNPWFDKLRRILYDDQSQTFIVATSEGFYFSGDAFETPLLKYLIQPPASVMGVTVFEKIDAENILVGSFEGLFLWQPKNGLIADYITKQAYHAPKEKGPPVGQYLISGLITDSSGNFVCFDYGAGAFYPDIMKQFPEMPENLKATPMSLWNLNLEIHTGRIFQFLIGDFYILIVPLTGLASLFIIISGFFIWFKQRKGQKFRKITGRE